MPTEDRAYRRNNRGPGRRCLLDASLSAGVYYGISAFIVFAGVCFGRAFIPQQYHPRSGGSPRLLDSFANWDGYWYANIARDGYFYDPQSQSSVAFFPAYPLLSRAVMRVSGVDAEAAMLVVSHAALIGVFLLLYVYIRQRSDHHLEDHELRDTVLAVFALWPTTMFFRMAYTESLFVLLLLLIMYGMQRRWNPVAIALIIGLATATRAVGVAALPVFALHLWRESATLRGFLVRSAVLMPVACWGIVAYMTFQYIEFGDALAFVKTQDHWARRPPSPLFEQLKTALILQPIWSVYDPSSLSYWRRYDTHAVPMFSLQFCNPIYFVLSTMLLILGARKRWLNEREIVLVAFLLLIPYLTHSHRALMMAQGRYAAAAFPLYIVVARLVRNLPPPIVALLGGFSGFLLGAYSALFAVWYRMI